MSRNIKESKEFIAWAINKLQAINYERYQISINVSGYNEPELDFNAWLDKNYYRLVEEFLKTDNGCV